MKFKDLMLYGVPALFVLDGITTYIGVHHLDIPEGNPLMIPLAGTVQGIILSCVLAFLFMRMIALDYLLNNFDKEVFRWTYGLLALFLLIFQIGNIFMIVTKLGWV